MLELIERLEDKIGHIEDMTSIIHGDFSLMNIMYSCQKVTLLFNVIPITYIKIY